MTPLLAQTAALFTNTALAAAGAAAVAIPVAIHLLSRLRRRREVWAAMRFLQEAFRKHRRRLRLEQFLLLLVRCLVVLVLGLALAGPLVGGIARGLGGAGGRVVCIIIDDSLGTRARQSTQASRFDALRRQALAIVDGLGDADRVGVWRAGRPVEPVLLPGAAGAFDRNTLRRTIEQLEPRYGVSDVPGALAAVAQTLSGRDFSGVPADRAFVVVLSDFDRDTVALDRPPPPELALLAPRAKVLAARPMPDAPNVQISSLLPRRQMILAEPDGSATIALELGLRRFASDDEALSSLELSVSRVDDQARLAHVRREHRWAAGQGTAVMNIELPLAAEEAPANGGETGVMLAVQAELEGAREADALVEDDRRWALVQLRRRLMVGMLDEPETFTAEGTLTPRRWVSLAVAPRRISGGAGGTIELIDVPAAAVEREALSPLDAALVLRPDLVSDSGWVALRQLAERGGLLWLFVPPGEAPAVWAAALPERLGVKWRVGVEPVSAPTSTDETGVDGESVPWKLALDAATPDPLTLLAADWAALLRPIRVLRRLDLTVPDTGELWLRTDEGHALLAAAPVGDGQVLLLASALDPQWTNLPAKPLWVPLLHETLRGGLGWSGAARRTGALLAGEQPLLDARWGSVQQLVGPGAPGAQVLLRRSDEGLTLASALPEPGLYTAVPASGDLALAVNVDPAAGNLQRLDEKLLANWFATAGNWEWFDSTQPLAAMSLPAQRANLSWPLLWATLALVLLETGMARWFSHAKEPARRGSLLNRFMGVVRGAGT